MGLEYLCTYIYYMIFYAIHVGGIIPVPFWAYGNDPPTTRYKFQVSGKSSNWSFLWKTHVVTLGHLFMPVFQ